jgi:hypothetical protein
LFELLKTLIPKSGAYQLARRLSLKSLPDIAKLGSSHEIFESLKNYVLSVSK